MWTHEQSYKGGGLAQSAHRARLKKILTLLNEVVHRLALEGPKKWADFGCSDGYILSLIQKNLTLDNNWHYYGFDHKEELLELANSRGLTNTEFDLVDLNNVIDKHLNKFDIVTCFETFEHTGNYKNAFMTIYQSCKINGFIIISLPNEVGMPGLLKFFGRKLLKHTDVYRGFFEGERELKYVYYLLFKKNIEHFRNKEVAGWGPHLGFDYRSFENFLTETYITEKKCLMLNRYSSFLDFNKIYVIKKVK